jgi:hypothetical protein
MLTYHVVIAVDRDAEGDPKPVELISPIVIERRARTGDPAAGAFRDAAILARSWRSSGKLISIRSADESAASFPGRRSLIKSHLRFCIRFWRMEAVSPNRPI